VKANAVYLDVIAQVTAGLPPKRKKECADTLAHLAGNAARWVERSNHASS
jgi:hypothetical protein